MGVVVPEADAEEGDPRQETGQTQETRRDVFGVAIPDAAAEEARDQTAEKRQEDNGVIHGVLPQPRMVLMSSTAIVPLFR